MGRFRQITRKQFPSSRNKLEPSPDSAPGKEACAANHDFSLIRGVQIPFKTIGGESFHTYESGHRKFENDGPDHYDIKSKGAVRMLKILPLKDGSDGRTFDRKRDVLKQEPLHGVSRTSTSSLVRQWSLKVEATANSMCRLRGEEGAQWRPIAAEGVRSPIVPRTATRFWHAVALFRLWCLRSQVIPTLANFACRFSTLCLRCG